MPLTVAAALPTALERWEEPVLVGWPSRQMITVVPTFSSHGGDRQANQQQ
ncbi:hypothetical protein RINTU1_32540 [Candidatus Regiella insecticola]|uniref:Uncharacterized protein n=1 Tax=Candidatus Regiella insecticola TaxID=138073 RepID=A0A6L2ZR61_9ENTR|nr:hypothetical protein RINTU1_32540 [Candidatus Regiella insecticola]